jgi:FKBP-type peptidyl-prolyl cis-trans isomerase 2
MPVFKKAIWQRLAVCLIVASFASPHWSSAEQTELSAPVVRAPDPVAAVTKDKGRAGETRRIEEGDLVTIDYSAFLEDGKLVYSTRSQDSKVHRVAAGYLEPSVFTPERVTAGKAARFPGVGESLVGLTEGDQKRITIPADKAFGLSNPQMVKRYPVTKTLDKTFRMSPPDYVKQFGGFPSEGKVVDITPYLKARVDKVTDAYAELEVVSDGTEHFEEALGIVEVRREGDRFKVTLSPKIGAPFKAEGGDGRIVSADADSFTVDFNPPLSGRAMVVDIRVLKITRASELSDAKISWVEEHDRGLASAKATGKPAVIVLYADWCQWCKKLLTESIPDPRIRELGERLVWIKVNSDLLKEYGTRYEQKGFPMIILLKPDGTIARKIEGYLDAAALRDALNGLIDGSRAS